MQETVEVTPSKEYIEIYKLIQLTPDQLLPSARGPLRIVSSEVVAFDENLHTELSIMRNTLYAFRGFGLSAVQVGLNKNMFVMDTTQDMSNTMEFINPTILDAGGRLLSKEGCLSFIGWADVIERFSSITLSFQDRNGESKLLTLEGIDAACAQHEMDHSIGTLFIDRLSGVKRNIFKRWFKKHGPRYPFPVPLKSKDVEYRYAIPNADSV